MLCPRLPCVFMCIQNSPCLELVYKWRWKGCQLQFEDVWSMGYEMFPQSLTSVTAFITYLPRCFEKRGLHLSPILLHSVKLQLSLCTVSKHLA